MAWLHYYVMTFSVCTLTYLKYGVNFPLPTIIVYFYKHVFDVDNMVTIESRNIQNTPW